MWAVLGLTVGAAALVDRHQSRARYSALGEPTRLDGISLRLPTGWEPPEESDSDALVELVDPHFNRAVSVSLRRPGFGEIFGFNADPRERSRKLLEKIPIGPGMGKLTYRAIPLSHGRQGSELVASATMGDGRILSITVASATDSKRGLPQSELDLIKRIAASVRFQPDSE